MRVVYYLVGSLLSVVVLLTLFLFNFNFGYFKPQIESQASKILGRAFVIEGPLDLTADLDRGIELRVEQARLAGPDWRPEPDLVYLESLKVNIGLKAILNLDPLMIDSIRVEGLKAHLEKDAQGRKTWVLFEPADEVEVEESETTDRLRIPVWPAELRLDNSSVVYIGPGEAEPIEFEVATLSERVLADTQVEVDLQGALNKKPVAIGLTSATLEGLISLLDLKLELDGNLGNIAITARAVLQDALNPNQPTAEMKITGPEISDIFEALGIQPITSGPLNIAFDMAPQGEVMAVQLDGMLGEFQLAVDGDISGLRELARVNLELAANGPNAGGVVDMFAPGLIPHAPFTISGLVTRSDQDIDIDNLAVRINQSSLIVDGHFENFPDPNGAAARAKLDIPDISRFGKLLGIPGEVSGPLQFEAEVKAREGGGGATINALANSLGISLSIDGSITDTTDFLGSDARVIVDAASIQSLLQAANVDLTMTAPVHLEVNVKRLAEGIAISDGMLTLAEDSLGLSGMVGNKPLEAGTALAMSLRIPQLARTLAEILPKNEHLTGLAHPLSLEAGIKLTDGIMAIDDAKLQLAENRLSASGQFSLEQSFANGQLVLTAASPDIIPLYPRPDSKSITRKIPLDMDAAVQWEDGLWSIEHLHLQLAQGTVDIQGTFDAPPQFTRTSIRLDAAVPSVKTLSNIAGQELPDLPAKIQGLISGDTDSVYLREFQAVVGKSDLSGEASYTAGDIPTVVASLQSSYLDVTPFRPAAAELPPAVPEDPSSATKKTQNNKNRKPKNAQTGVERLIPDTPLPLASLNTINAKLNIEFKELKVSQHSLQDISLTGSLQDGALIIEEAKLVTRKGGRLKALLKLIPNGNGADLRMRVKGDTLNLGFPAPTPEDYQLLPIYTVDLAALSQGSTVRDLAEGLNGYLRVVSGPGKVKTGSLKLLTNDFIAQLIRAVNPFAWDDKEPYASLGCATVLAAVESGELYGEPVLVLQTDKLHIYAKTEVNLKSEVVDLEFKTVPQEGLGLSLTNLVNPYVMVGGTLANPHLSFNEESAIKHGTAAVLTGGISILAGSILDRYNSPKDPCGKSLIEGNKGLQDLEKKYTKQGAPKGWLDNI